MRGFPFLVVRLFAGMSDLPVLGRSGCSSRFPSKSRTATLLTANNRCRPVAGLPANKPLISGFGQMGQERLDFTLAHFSAVVFAMKQDESLHPIEV